MSINNIKSRHSIIRAIEEYDILGEEEFLSKYGFGKAKEFILYYNNKKYPSKAIVGVAYGYEFPEDGPLTADEFSGGQTTVVPVLKRLGFKIVSRSINQEIEYRKELYDTLIQYGGPKNIPASLINELKIYYGGRGIWMDKTRTSKIVDEGITVGLLHTGKHYADDLTDDGVLYHYPDTKNKGHDNSEITATKKAGELGVPLFVITHSAETYPNRDVYFGWVEDWDDKSKIFLISFTPTSDEDQFNYSYDHSMDDEIPFTLKETRSEKYSTTERREGQQKFRFDVFKRYGTKCAVCGIEFSEMLIAAHLHPKEKEGSNDPRNGLVLCANHHVAYDKNLFGINPENYQIRFKSNGPSKNDLKIEVSNLLHLINLPHPDSLRFQWKEFNK